jgi:hypothetical protein
VLKCPNIYLDSKYLRYIGWLLSDIDSHVRMESLKSLSLLYNEKTVQHGLGPFSERFKQRITEMARLEVEPHVRLEACKVVVLIGELGYFEAAEDETILPLLMDNDERIREAIGPYIASIHKDQYEEELQQQLEDSNETEDDSARFSPFKSLAKMLVSVVSLTKASEAFSVTEAEKIELEQLDASVSLPIEVPELGSAEREAERDRMELEVADMAGWIKQDDEEFESSISAHQIDIAVSVLSRHLPFIKVP